MAESCATWRARSLSIVPSALKRSIPALAAARITACSATWLASAGLDFSSCIRNWSTEKPRCSAALTASASRASWRLRAADTRASTGLPARASSAARDMLLTSCFAGPGIFVIFTTRRFLTASMKTSLADRGRIAEDKLDILQGLLVSTVLERQIRSFGANGEARGIEIGILRQDPGVVTIEDGARLVVRLAQVVMGEDAANLAAAHTGELVAHEGQGQDRAVSIQEI